MIPRCKKCGMERPDCECYGKPASPVAQPEDERGPQETVPLSNHMRKKMGLRAVAQSGAGGITDTYEEGDENPNNIRFTYPPSSPSGQAAAPTQEAHTPKNVYQLFKHKKDCTWATPLPTGEGYWGCSCGLDSLLIGLEDFELADSFSPVSSDEQFWQFMEENAGIVKRWPGWKRIAAGLSAASPTGGAEPLDRELVRQAVFIAACKLDGGTPSTKPLTAAGVQVLADAAFDAMRANITTEPAASEPSAWPSDLSANGTGAMNLLTNFWTGDLKGLTKEGARIVDSLVAHVTKGMRAAIASLELWKGCAEGKLKEMDELETEAAGLREQLEQAKKERDEQLENVLEMFRRDYGPLPKDGDFVTVMKLIDDADDRAEAAEAQLATLNMVLDLTATNDLFVQPAEGGGWVFWVNVNDMFYPASDGEGVDISEIPAVWKAWKESGWTGVVRWVQEKRGGLKLRKSREEKIITIDGLRAELATAREAGNKLQIVKFVSDGDGDWVAVRRHGFDKLRAALVPAKEP